VGAMVDADAHTVDVRFEVGVGEVDSRWSLVVGRIP